MEGLIEGRIVHYVMPDGEHRPAVVVKVWDHEGETGTSNLQIITDGPNDVPWGSEGKALEEKFVGCGIKLDDVRHGHFWRTSVRYSATPEPETWHWIERV